VVHNPSGTPTGGIDDAIAMHAASRGHWPGKTPDQIKQLIADVRSGWNNRYSAPSGETIYRQGDVILIENPVRWEGTTFEPSGNALEYFRRWVRRNPGGT
jgi:hypothetical protein